MCCVPGPLSGSSFNRIEWSDAIPSNVLQHRAATVRKWGATRKQQLVVGARS